MIHRVSLTIQKSWKFNSQENWRIIDNVMCDWRWWSDFIDFTLSKKCFIFRVQSVCSVKNPSNMSLPSNLTSAVAQSLKTITAEFCASKFADFKQEVGTRECCACYIR